jgi:hypothetical protein
MRSMRAALNFLGDSGRLIAGTIANPEPIDATRRSGSSGFCLPKRYRYASRLALSRKDGR